MKTTRSHASIVEVLSAADVPPYYSQPSNGTSRSMLPIRDEEAWMRDRQRSLDRMRAKKMMRRGVRTPKGYVTEPEFDEEDDSEGEEEAQSLHERDPWRGHDHDEEENAWSPPLPKKRRPSHERRGEVLADREENHNQNQNYRPHKPQRKKQSGHRHIDFHVSNPNSDTDYQYSPQPQYEVEKRDMWRADLAKIPSSKYAERQRERDAYMLTHDALSYSYGQA